MEMSEKLFLLTEREREYGKKGIMIAGADEAGRGPLAGPVVAAAVIMPADFFIEGINDSKKISEKKRELLYEEIVKNAISYKAVFKDVEVIEEINILEATRLAFCEALNALNPQPGYIFTDAMDKLKVKAPFESVIKGDAKIYSIAAASIIAKVTRDRYMREMAGKYPEYGFEKHKGYGSAAHIAAIKKYGPCPIHRLSFLKKILAK